MRPLACCCLLLLAACPGAPAAGAPAGAARATGAPVKVETLTATAESVPRLLEVTGTLKASAESEVAANAVGRVARTLVERGSRVEKGAPLLVLDSRQATLAAAEAQANLEATRTQRSLAEAECQRNQRLFEKRAITEEEREKADATCQQQKQSEAAADSRQKQAALTLEDMTVRAPFAGVVSERYVNVGEYVRADTRVVQLVQADPVRLELAVGEADAGAVRAGQTVRFQVKALPGKSFEATVRYVAPALRKATRDLLFEAVAGNGEGLLKPGTFAVAQVEVGTDQLVVLPRSALRSDGETFRAFVVQDGKLVERVVQKVRDLDGKVAIGRGIEAGERVVRTLTERLGDGQAVN